MAHTMRIMYRRNCIKYMFTSVILCIMVSLYLVALKHNTNVHERFHFKRLKIKRDVHSQTQVRQQPVHSQTQVRQQPVHSQTQVRQQPVYSQTHAHVRQRAANVTSLKEPPRADVSHVITNDMKERLHVYIVDEHHEVIPYWFAAAGRKIIPKSGNTLVHIDGHADLAPPVYVPGFPFFIWPREKELKFLMQSNDAFIQASAIVGLVNRLIWIWPSWDKDDHEARYVMSTLSLGWMTVQIPGGHAQKAFCMCMKNETNTECRTLTSDGVNRTRESSGSRVNEGFVVSRSLCKIKRIMIVEEIDEGTAYSYLKKRDWIAKNENIILDIDEDFYGCNYAITPLLKANLTYNRIYNLDSLIKSHICPTTSKHEKESDRFLLELIAIARAQRTCNKDTSLKHSEKCQTATKIDLRGQFGRQLDKSVVNKTIQMCSLKNAKKFVGTFILKLAEFSTKQLRALQKVGFCLNTSPKTLTVFQKHKFGICIGANTPKRTVVTEHTPTKSEIVSRSILLKGLFQKINNFSLKLVTISRSMRDGYTPRQFSEEIEKDILNGLNVTVDRPLTLHYDSDLLGGKPGWPSRHKA